MRQAARTDANHRDVVKYIRQCGMSVADLSGVGKGVPDLLVGWRGWCCLVEVKDGAKPPSKQQLTKAESDWRAAWAGPYIIATSPENAVEQLVDAYEKTSYAQLVEAYEKR